MCGIYCNIQGLTGNHAELQHNCMSRNFDFVILSETHTTENIEDSEIVLEGYQKPIRCDSDSRHTGGLCIYIKNNFEVSDIKKTMESRIWWLSCKLTNNNRSVYIAAIYRAHSSSKRVFCDKMMNWIEDLVDSNKPFILAGDMNIDWLDDSNLYRNNLKNIIESENHCQQIVCEPTRVTNNTRTLIDYVIAESCAQTKAKVDYDLKMSDHETIYIEIYSHTKVINESEVSTYKALKYNRTSFLDNLRNNSAIGYLHNAENPNIMGKILEDELIKITNMFIRSKVIKSGVGNWYNITLQNMKREKIAKYQEFRFCNSEECWNSYRVLRNRYKIELVKARNKNIKRRIFAARDQKSMWRIIKSCVLNIQKEQIKVINFNGENIKDNKEIAKKFNQFFVNSIIEINNSIPFTQLNQINFQPTETFKFKPINIFNIKNILKLMNQKKDFNFISAKMILDAIDVIGPIMVRLINLSIGNGAVPETWKESVVTPVEKVKGTNMCENFRPVNALPVHEKVLEKVVQIQLEEYFESNNLFLESQSGFRKKHSCEAALNNVIICWKEENAKKNFVIAVFLDFKRAFETIDRSILLSKLRGYGIGGMELKWFESFLSNRSQRTMVNGISSSSIETKIGVPQGSILGALLFIIYINDIKTAMKYSQIALFADDALLFISGKNIEECEKKLQNDLYSLSNWLKANKLKLNVAKSKCMVFKHGHRLNLNVDNERIEQVEEIKYLGVIIDFKLKFDKHLNYTAKKVSKKVLFFGRIRNKISTISAINIFNVMVKPHFEYCSSILYLCSDNMLLNIQRIQNRAMRIILKCSRYTPVALMLSMLQWLSVKQRILVNVLCFVFKIKNDMLPTYLKKYLRYVGESQPYHLRNGGDFRLPPYLTNETHNSIVYKGFRLYNSMPYDVKNERNFAIFKRKTINYIRCNFPYF